MRRPALSLALSVLLFVSPILPSSGTAAQSNAVAGQLTLQDGTPVRLRLNHNVSSADATVGESVDFEVLDEVIVSGIAVIPKGSTAIGTVTEADTEKAAVRAVKDAKGGGHTGGMTAGIVATGLIFWPAAPFFLFMHGKDITVPKGAEVVAYVNGDQKLSAARFSPANTDQTQVSSTASSSSAPANSTVPNTSAPGSIYVHSSPDSAEVYVDGSLVGDTPATLKLNPGQHTIRVVSTGYKEWSRQLTVQAGWEAHLAAVLEKNEPAGEMYATSSTKPVSSKESVPATASTNAVNDKELVAPAASVNVSQKPVGWIGVHAQNRGDAAVVTNVSPDGPAANAGIQAGDIILALDGRLLKGRDFETAVATLKPGTQILVSYARGSSAHEVLVTVSSRTM